MIPTTSLTTERLAPSLDRLRDALDRHAVKYPGERPGRQPVHTVYGGAHLFRAEISQKLGALALGLLDQRQPQATALAELIRVQSTRGELAAGVTARLLDKLAREPVEDYRIDFEDGYGVRSDEEEDGHARTAAQEVAKGMAAGTLPPFLGIRVKGLTAESHGRALRTLEVFFTTLAGITSRVLPPWLVVTLPKVEVTEQVETLLDALEALETSLGFPPSSIRVELMVELPAALIAVDGTVALPRLVDAARGRCVAVHLGAYDLTAACGVVTARQSLAHAYCKQARALMKLSLAGRGVWLVDGATTTFPIAPHPAVEGTILTALQHKQNHDEVFGVMYRTLQTIHGALADGYYQGWDLHPSQLLVRYAAVYSFFARATVSEGERLRGFVARAARATRSGGVFDDAATGQGMLNFFLRGHACGAFTADDVVTHTGLSVETLATRSFAQIVALHGPSQALPTDRE